MWPVTLGLNPRPNIVLATGDLVDLALPHDYAVLRAMLNRLEMPLYVIPGNHDDREAMRRTFGDVSYLRDCEAFLHYTVEPYPLRLIGLDTMLPGEVRGGLCANRLHWLADRLAEQPDRPTLIFMHHPPFASGIAFLDTPPFEGAEAMARLIGAHRQVRQLVCGHIHRALHVNWAGTCAAVAPSTVYQMALAFDPDRSFGPSGDPPAISLYRWRDGLGPVGYISLIPDRVAQKSAAVGVQSTLPSGSGLT